MKDSLCAVTEEELLVVAIFGVELRRALITAGAEGLSGTVTVKVTVTMAQTVMVAIVMRT